MDQNAERKHRHELKRKAKRTQVRLQKAHARGNAGERGGIGEYGSRSRHHQQGNMPVAAQEIALCIGLDPAPQVAPVVVEALAPCSVCGRLTGGCCTVAVQE